MSPEFALAKGVTFGKLTLPDIDSRKPNQREETLHAPQKVNRVKRHDETGGTKRQHSSPKRVPSVGSSRSKTKRKHKEEHERDWEREWRASGGAGGPVIEWGKEIDREQKKAKKEAAKVSGQRYVGGY
ncbi:MAG: hypothetical protein TREMPRED_002167 [Tremellales sp. Tagirdzhanova-0007]|nr:MAG: hypothetical protein TREMPRED_002167 [Tremellales sp. Tagirdzhanova-0007]